ncbi:hypothetical protein VTK73DRAFT_5029 [Phialemonium thermophilum]|uniref:SAP domain-containing protein n=1 Tax=Phialemonium thermophilum TaxID=223376 RepID=A0ABR3WQJ9_9PEZI
MGPLRELSVHQLRTLALQCGIARSGTKGALIQRIQQVVRDHRPLDGGACILSIDLGIRNLAYCLITAPPGRPHSSRPLSVVHAWHALSLVPPACTAVGEKTTEEKKKRADGGDLDTSDVSPSILRPKLQQQEDFSPASLSEIAVGLVRDKLLPLQPTHVLVERQRFRSAGGPAVFEWTVRVNSLEAMLYATFGTLKALGHWDGIVAPVDPKRVASFLVEGEIEDAPQGADGQDIRLCSARSNKRTSREVKRQKMDLLGQWLSEGRVSMGNPQAKAMRTKYLDRWMRKGGKETRSGPDVKVQEAGSVDGLKKLDDVADSLLQGVSWLKWQENRSRLQATIRT